MALTVAVQEVDEQADDSPENEHQLRAVRQAEEEINAARDRDWSSKIKARCAARTAPMRIGLAQHHNGDRHCGEGEQRTGIGNVSQIPNRAKCGAQRYNNASHYCNDISREEFWLTFLKTLRKHVDQEQPHN